MSKTVRPILIVLLFSILGITWFFNLNYYKLFNPDESRYAQIAREMNQTGDFITPHLNGVKYLEKPALHYWINAFFFKILGECEASARLWSATAGFLSVLFLFFVARRLYGIRVALFSSLVLICSPLFYGVGHLNNLDMGLNLFLEMAFGFMLLSQQKGITKKEEKKWLLCMWAAMGLSFMTKGLIGALLPFLVLISYTFLARDWQLWKKLYWGQGLVIFLLIVLPWFAIVSIKNPEFLHFFFIHEHFERFITGHNWHLEPFWYFIPIGFAGLFPWCFCFPLALRENFKNKEKNFLFHRRLTFLWALVIFLFFSSSSSKLITYILPIYPALALMIGSYLEKQDFRFYLWAGLLCALFALTGIITFSPLTSLHEKFSRPELHQNFFIWVMIASMIFFVASILAIILSRKKKTFSAICLFSVLTLLSFQICLIGYSEFSPKFSSYELAQVISPYVKKETKLYYLGQYDHGVTYYLNHQAIVVYFMGELEFGLKHGDQEWIHDYDEFASVWENLPPHSAVAVMRTDIFQLIQKKNLSMKILFQDARRVAIGR